MRPNIPAISYGPFETYPDQGTRHRDVETNKRTYWLDALPPRGCYSLTDLIAFRVHADDWTYAVNAVERWFLTETDMLEILATILIVLWLLGLVSSYTFGGFIHILLVIALVAVVLRLIRGRRPF